MKFNFHSSWIRMKFIEKIIYFYSLKERHNVKVILFAMWDKILPFIPTWWVSKYSYMKFRCSIKILQKFQFKNIFLGNISQNIHKAFNQINKILNCNHACTIRLYGIIGNKDWTYHEIASWLGFCVLQTETIYGLFIFFLSETLRHASVDSLHHSQLFTSYIVVIFCGFK